MIYFSLPNLYNQFNLLHQIYLLNKNEINKFKIPVRFISITENLPFNYSNGNINYNKDFFFNYFQLQEKSQKQTEIIKRINMSNIYFCNTDFNDSYCNLILQCYESGSSEIEISDIDFLEYILNTYPNYQFILSPNILISNNITINALNQLINSNIISLFSLPYYYNNSNFIFQIENKTKIELTINPLCSCSSIEQCQNCICQENKLIYNFSNQSHILQCVQTNNNFYFISLNDIINNYLKQGINHYKLNEFSNTKQSFYNFLYFFVEFFIKQEFQMDILKRLQEAIIYD